MLGPVEPLVVLHPLEVGDDDPTRVREDIRNHEYIPVAENIVNGGCYRSSRDFGDDIGSDVGRERFVDSVLQCGGTQEVDIERKVSDKGLLRGAV